jgi:hypothetical protein
VKSSKSKGRNNARHKKFKDQHPAVSGESGVWKVRWLPCFSVGKEQGQSKGVLGAMRKDVRESEGKTKMR